MPTKLKSLKEGMLAGMAAEKTRSDAIDRFARAEAALSEHPNGLLQNQRAANPPIATFSAESAVANVEGRLLIRVPIANLHDNPFNARRIYDPAVVQERAASIATHGQKTPGLAAPDAARPGHYILIDGHYRKRALASAGKLEMECFIEDDLSDLDFYRLSFLLNEQRSDQSALDNAIAWRQLLDEGKVQKEEEICELTGMSAGTVNKTLALLKLPESVIAVMRERPSAIGIAAGYELTLYCKIAGEDRTRELATRIMNDGLSSREVESIRKQAQEGKSRKVKEISRQYKIRTEAGQLLGTIKEWDSGRIMLDVQLTDRNAREDLLEVLKARFGLDKTLL
ncbi:MULTISPECIES: ParB/RepB/Spo0J family partition protein [unclassified Cupriavidus]|uniref:ParB/RepB/Spo0J family partition protein n=1 Tax=unclassified Cupriavidus TaxID=2640874 RepID=UPI001C0047C4|nr:MULTISPECIES: ParB/RepB/Spo0J family partition protein [unclassified Cupriavidus]MCA3192231.1 ParB/RepB/Spo0J family partition protein [Cupriavidus sp.]MCA3196006.1 ParB/RepB/Spo0J family partition protein [Cupriavidus sp.]MCA3203539.1 ParB/RepB/Spo0J family partition protein [Cupriavidus sp.]MCA3207047.1 ParB/RepB/Spo0J family partition protein [Cupriavidus sp.]QWE96108.1 ParB/RepB/Spo0J family partition protein [Cupriavidus sp. EM10]